jgi:hypothetical protein
MKRIGFSCFETISLGNLDPIIDIRKGEIMSCEICDGTFGRIFETNLGDLSYTSHEKLEDCVSELKERRDEFQEELRKMEQDWPNCNKCSYGPKKACPVIRDERDKNFELHNDGRTVCHEFKKGENNEKEQTK